MVNRNYVNPQIGFVDLATFDEFASYMYGGRDAVCYFLRSTQRGNWFAFVPISLRHVGEQKYGSEFSANFNRGGDFALNAFVRVKNAKIELYDAGGGALNADAAIQYTRNYMHNLFSCISLTFNELSLLELDPIWLDVVQQFKTCCKQVAYQNMIGDVPSMTSAKGPGVALGTGGYLNLPLPLPFAEDSGVALGVAQLPFNEIRLNYVVRDWQDLVMLNPGTAGGRAATYSDIRVVGTTSTEPYLPSVETWSHYVIIHNNERQKLGSQVRDMVLQTVARQSDQTLTTTHVNDTVSFDIKTSSHIWGMFWGAKNISLKGMHSNYTTDINHVNGVDPIASSQLLYENQTRFQLGSDYFSMVSGWYFAPQCPERTGYHAYFWSLQAWARDPMGSVGFGKLINVTLEQTVSQEAVNASGNGTSGTPDDIDGAQITWAGANVNQKFRHYIRFGGFTIVRLQGGSIGLPVF